MVTPLMNCFLKGFLWYLREANNDRAKEYQRLFVFLIQDWRNQWKEDHPANKMEVGQRLTLIARNVVYNDKKVIYWAPVYRPMKIDKYTIILNFNLLGRRVKINPDSGHVITSFEIFGNKKKFIAADAEISGNINKESGKACVNLLQYANHGLIIPKRLISSTRRVCLFQHSEPITCENLYNNLIIN